MSPTYRKHSALLSRHTLDISGLVVRASERSTITTNWALQEDQCHLIEHQHRCPLHRPAHLICIPPFMAFLFTTPACASQLTSNQLQTRAATSLGACLTAFSIPGRFLAVTHLFATAPRAILDAGGKSIPSSVCQRSKSSSFTSRKPDTL